MRTLEQIKGDRARLLSHREPPTEGELQLELLRTIDDASDRIADAIKQGFAANAIGNNVASEIQVGFVHLEEQLRKLRDAVRDTGPV